LALLVTPQKRGRSRGKQNSASTPLALRTGSTMFLWLSTWILSISLVRSAEIIRVPLIQLSKPAGSGFSKRSTIGFSSLTDDVNPGHPYVDLAYLGQVSIGNPPQNFLLSKSSLSMGVDEISIRVQRYSGLRIGFVWYLMCLMPNYSIRVYRLRVYLLDKILKLFME